MNEDKYKIITYYNQIEILKYNGIIIEDEKKALLILSNFNYYSFIEYLNQFKDIGEKYKENITFNQIYKIYIFDIKFRNILFQILEMIEISLKTKFAYISAHKIGALGYRDKANFKDEKEFNIFLNKIKWLKQKNKSSQIKKYNENIPIWIAINLFTMGMLYNYYKNLYENQNPTLQKYQNSKSIRKQLAGEYNTGEKQFESWLENILYARNMVAHYMRIYNFKLQKTPAKCNKNHKDNYIVTYRIFDIVHIMKFFILDKNEWNNYILNMEALFDEYHNYIDINLLGFPKNWIKILRK